MMGAAPPGPHQRKAVLIATIVALFVPLLVFKYTDFIYRDVLGPVFGWQGTLLTIFLGALIGSLIFVPLSLAGRKRLVPFGIFLAIGAAACYLVGPAILSWYGGYLEAA